LLKTISSSFFGEAVHDVRYRDTDHGSEQQGAHNNGYTLHGRRGESAVRAIDTRELSRGSSSGVEKRSPSRPPPGARLEAAAAAAVAGCRRRRCQVQPQTIDVKIEKVGELRGDTGVVRYNSLLPLSEDPDHHPKKKNYSVKRCF
jgi:hypothetical protein